MFPNLAGPQDSDAVVRSELEQAGIPVDGLEILRESSGEVSTSLRGVLHGWIFRRGWRYWVCKGPGIEVEAAEKLHATHGTVVRVDGNCTSPSPRDWFKGLACGNYHVDSQEGLKALADTIQEIVKEKGNVSPIPS